MSEAAVRDADAIRYIVLRKLASGLRHTLMGELQSIQFLAEVGARLLASGADETRARECVSKIPVAATEAIATCHSVIEWLRPEEGAAIALGDAVGQCVKLAGDGWRMRATTAVIQMSDATAAASVSKAAARELVITSLLALTDQNPGPLDILVAASQEGKRIDVQLQVRVSGRVSPFRPSIVHRALSLDDVKELAAEHGVACACADGAITLRFDPAPGNSRPAQRGPDVPRQP